MRMIKWIEKAMTVMQTWMRFAIMIALSITFCGNVIAQEQNTSTTIITSQLEFQEAFEKLSTNENLKLSLYSLRILALENKKYWKLLQLLPSGTDPSTNLTIAKGNPFYKDSYSDYEEFFETIMRAKIKLAQEGEALNSELEHLLKIVQWRMSYLEEISDTEESQRKKLASFTEKLEKANSKDSLRNLIKEYRKYNIVAKARVKLAKLLIKDLEAKPFSKNFIIANIRPQENAPTGFVTILDSSEGGIALVEYPEGSGGGLLETLPAGNGSVHCYKGEYTWRIGNERYKFNGDQEEPMMFVLLRNVGYVYLHGKGKITLPDGKDVKF